VKVVVFGATGVTGRAALEHFVAQPDCTAVGVSRRPPDVAGAAHLAVDLDDRRSTQAALGSPATAGTTHVVYAALQESPDLVSGWTSAELVERNTAMFRNALEPLLDADSVQHVALLQGGKAYGLHLGRVPIPAKERAARDQHENFYFRQEDVLRRLADRHGFGWTILRPPPIFGQSFGSPMNLLPAIGVYAAVCRERGEPFAFPGGPPQVHEAVDARLLARALAWAGQAAGARNETFNVTNGDVYDWHAIWPTLADALGVEWGPARPRSLAAVVPGHAEVWARIVDRYGLAAPRELHAYVGNSWIYADLLFGAGRTEARTPALLSTVKLRQAGFGDCIDTEDMFREWSALLQERRLLPR
jgi:nucleoside-diphosphate-sugar epimerase